jgi:ribokinase
MIGAVGEDAFGDEFVASLEREGVDASRIQRLSHTYTAVAAPLVTPDGDVGFVHAPGANRELTLERFGETPQCDIVFVQGEVPVAISLAICKQVRRGGGLVFLNPAPVHDVTPALIAAADILCPNEVEAMALVGVMSVPEHDPRQLVKRLSVAGRTVVITLGSRGAAFLDEGRYRVVAPPRINAVDATGAGDSFCAALGLSLAEGTSLAVAVRFACAAGAHAATVRGAEPGLPTRTQVEALLSA